MLRRIKIQNHALIHEVELHLEDGFHVFTGETGSGKSILLGAIGLLLGNRADTSSVGLQGDRAVVEGEFFAPQLKEWLTGHDFPEAIVVGVRREVLRNGRSRVFINDAQGTVGQLRDLGTHLVSIHHQDDLGDALEPNQLADVLDLSASDHMARAKYEEAFANWSQAKHTLGELEALSRNPSGDVDYLKHQIAELERLNLGGLNWKELEAELNSLQHSAELHGGLQHAAMQCDSDEAGALGLLETARRSLLPVEGVDADVDEALRRLQSLRIELQDLAGTLHDLVERKQPDPERLKHLEARHDAVMRALRKHNVDEPDALLTLLDTLSGKVDALQGLEGQLLEARKQASEALEALHAAGQALTTQRMQSAQDMTSSVLPLLHALKMPHARMDWHFDDCEPQRWGTSEPAIWFSSNPGSSLLPLTKVASGGERSRFMLSLKSVLAKLQSTPVVVLDEIDTGVSGEVAAHMGRAMKDISSAPQTQQVLAITHLPQVAACAQHHWEVSKSTDGASTHVEVKRLDDTGRQLALATMLSGSIVTEEALGQASKLLTSA